MCLLGDKALTDLPNRQVCLKCTELRARMVI